MENTNHVDDEIGQFSRVIGRQIVTTALDQEKFGIEFSVKILKSRKIGRDILANGGVRTSARFDGTDSRSGQGRVFGQELGILPDLTSIFTVLFPELGGEHTW